MSISQTQCKSCQAHYRDASDYLSQTSGWRVCSNGMLWLHCACDALITLEQGHYDWFQPEALFVDRKVKLYKELMERNELPRVKSSVLQLNELLSTSDPELKKIEQIVKTEPIILGEILSTANKLRETYGDDNEIEGIQHALVYLGHIRLKHLVLAANFKIIQVPPSLFSSGEFWDQAFSQAIVAEYLAKKFAPYLNKDEVYLSGYLANIGKLMSAFYFPEKIDRLLKAQRNPKNRYSWSKLEKVYEMYSQFEIGEIVCKLWGVPDYVIDTCAKQLKPEETSASIVSLNDIMILANSMVNWLEYRPLEVDQESVDVVAKKLNLSVNDLDLLVSELSLFLRKKTRAA